MSWTVVRLQDVQPQPWRNGGGVTQELLAWPDAQEWAVRMSVAQVASDGPFSGFPGVTRWFAVLSGHGVRLEVDGAPHLLTKRDAPFRFDGGAKVDCGLVDGTTQDFNLMVRARRARMVRVLQSHAAACEAGTLVAAFAVGVPAVLRDGASVVEMPPGTLAWRILDSSGAALEITGGDALWMEIDP